MDEINRFLSNFKKLESELVKLSSLDDDYISFSRALSNVYQRKINDVVSDEDNYDILKQASDLRNILSHENNVCIPTSSFNEKFEEIVDAIVNPLTCLDIATLRKDLTFASVDDKITSVCKLMNERGYSNIPVYDNGKVIGVFSRTTFFDYLYKKKNISINDNTINDLREEIIFSSHTAEDFLFVSRKVKAYSLLNYFSKKRIGDKRISLIFVTENGKKDEFVLGVLTESDLLKIPLYKRKIQDKI